MTTPSITRPLCRWHGGKWRLAPWIISHFPPHQIYVEPFGGGGSVLLRKPRSFVEVYNDLDGDVVELFRVMRDPDQSARLIEMLRMTPFARREFECARELATEPIEIARRLVVRMYNGFGNAGANRAVNTGFRANSKQARKAPAREWAAYPDNLASVADRLRGVVVEKRDAMTVAAANDTPKTLHYFDPPYMPDTRSMKSMRGRLKYHAYAHEMTEADHERFLIEAFGLVGAVVISGYPSEMYDVMLCGWRRVETTARADSGHARTEVLWLNF